VASPQALHKDPENVRVADDAHQSVVLHDRQAADAVPDHHLGRLLNGQVRRDGDDVPVHDLSHGHPGEEVLNLKVAEGHLRFGGRVDQVLLGGDPDQFAAPVHHGQVAETVPADQVQRVFDGYVGGNRNRVGGHTVANQHISSLITNVPIYQ
jgi:hypothetical protein